MGSDERHRPRTADLTRGGRDGGGARDDGRAWNVPRQEIPYEAAHQLLSICACAAVALIGCGSSSDDGSSGTPDAHAETGILIGAGSGRQPGVQRCDDIQAQVKTLGSLSTGSATRADVTSALTAIQADLQKIKGAQADLAPDRKQQVQEAAAAFGMQLKDTLKQTVSGLTKTDAQTQAEERGRVASVRRSGRWSRSSAESAPRRRRRKGRVEPRRPWASLSARGCSVTPEPRRRETRLSRSNQNGAPRLSAAIVTIHPGSALHTASAASDAPQPTGIPSA